MRCPLSGINGRLVGWNCPARSGGRLPPWSPLTPDYEHLEGLFPSHNTVVLEQSYHPVKVVMQWKHYLLQLTG